jgi:hypothetical protein
MQYASPRDTPAAVLARRAFSEERRGQTLETEVVQGHDERSLDASEHGRGQSGIEAVDMHHLGGQMAIHPLHVLHRGA